MDFSETRGHQEDKPLTGVVEHMRRLGLIRPRDPSPSLGGRPLLAVSGSSCGQLAVSSHVLWIVCGRLPLREYRGPGPVRASVLLSRVLVEAGVTPAVHLHGPALLATPHHYRKVPGWHVTSCTTRQQRLRYERWLDFQRHWGPPCSDDPVSNSAVTGALVAGRAVTYRRRVKRHSRDIPQLCP